MQLGNYNLFLGIRKLAASLNISAISLILSSVFKAAATELESFPIREGASYNHFVKWYPLPWLIAKQSWLVR